MACLVNFIGTQGHPKMTNAWDHDWRTYVYTELASKGYSTLLEFVRQHNQLSYHALAASLSNVTNKIAPIQVQSILRAETEGTDDFSYFVRTSLVRNLLHHTPNGIRKHGDWRLILALSSWAGSMGPELQEICGKIARSLKSDLSISDDWIPISEADPKLELLFSKYGL